MGLDMYLDGRKFLWTNWETPEKNVMEDGFKLKGKELELAYWRKHPNLHGYIVQAFAGGKDECQDIELGAEDIDTIIGAIKARNLPETTGFFFGRSYGTDEEAANDISLFQRAKEWLAERQDGVSKSVVYRASW